MSTTSLQFPYFTLLLFAATALACVSAFEGWRNREVSGSTPFVILMSLVAYWSVTYGLQLVFPSLDAQLLWDSVQYPGGFLTPVAFLGFVLYYTGYEHVVTLWRLLAAAVLPLITALLVWIPQFQHLVRLDAELLEMSSYVLVEITYGPLFYLTVGYSYILVALGIGVLVVTTLQTPALYRRQSLLITMGAVVPICGSVITYFLDLTPIDLTPVGLAIFGVTLVLAFTRYRLLEVYPIARNKVIRGVHDGILVTDPNGRVVDINPAAKQIFTLDGGIGTELSSFASDTEPLLADMSDDETVEFVTNGEDERYIECRKTTLTDLGQIERASIYILHDVTERRIREQWFQALTEYSSDIISVVDENLQIKYVSPSVERVLGYEPQAIEGTSLLDRVHQEDTAAVREAVLTDPDPEIGITYRMKASDGSWRTLQSRSKNQLSDPIVEGIVVNTRDITESQARKRELERKNERLEEFASVLSHDLRNPLTVASGRLELLDVPADTEHTVAIRQAHDRIEALIDDLLTLAQQGKSIGETTEVSIPQVASRAWQQIEKDTATLEIDVDLMIEADKSRFQQLFENLFRNAIEHGGDTVTISVGYLSESAGFYIEDDGPGIPPAKRKDVVQAGFSDTEDGTGFGLSIVKQIVEGHDWQLSITESDEGGARFEISNIEYKRK